MKLFSQRSAAFVVLCSAVLFGPGRLLAENEYDRLGMAGIEAQKAASEVWGEFRVMNVHQTRDVRTSSCCAESGTVVVTQQSRFVVSCFVGELGKNSGKSPVAKESAVDVTFWRQVDGPRKATYDRFGEVPLDRKMPEAGNIFTLFFLPGDVNVSGGRYELVPSFGYQYVPREHYH